MGLPEFRIIQGLRHRRRNERQYMGPVFRMLGEEGPSAQRQQAQGSLGAQEAGRASESSALV